MHLCGHVCIYIYVERFGFFVCRYVERNKSLNVQFQEYVFLLPLPGLCMLCSPLHKPDHTYCNNTYLPHRVL